MNEEQYNEIMDRLDFIEFRQQLLFNNDEVSRLLFECNVTHKQYQKIMGVMETYRVMIGRKEKVSHTSFENEIYTVMGRRNDIDYHFCEGIALAFRNQDRWNEVFDALYGDMPKYAYLKD